MASTTTLGLQQGAGEILPSQGHGWQAVNNRPAPPHAQQKDSPILQNNDGKKAFHPIVLETYTYNTSMFHGLWHSCGTPDSASCVFRPARNQFGAQLL